MSLSAMIMMSLSLFLICGSLTLCFTLAFVRKKDPPTASENSHSEEKMHE